MTMLDPNSFIITRKRKKYKFAVFANSPICFEMGEWERSFRPDVLEMGAGTGLFSVGLAKAAPDKRFVAVDVKADRLQTGALAAEESSLENIRFLRARADQLAQTLAPGSLERIWITFPDPFPKGRSAKHRLTHSNYLAMYQKLLRPGGELYFKTDAGALFEWSLEQLVKQGWGIRDVSFDLHESDLPAAYKSMTTYEKRFVGEGLRIQFVRAVSPSR